MLERFKTTGVGIFKLVDVWTDFETIMGLKPGEGKSFIEEVLEEFDHGPGNGLDGSVTIPIICLMFSPAGEVQTYLSYRAYHSAFSPSMLMFFSRWCYKGSAEVGSIQP